MPATVGHNLSATTPDNPSFEIRPSHWNSVHDVTLNISATEISGLFSNANGLSFGLSNNSITGSYTVPTAFVFSNSNGVSFGTNGSTITATVATNYQSQGAYLTTAALSNHSHGNPQLNLTNLSGTTASNSGGFTLSLSAGNYLTTAMASNRGTDFVQANAVFNGTNASGTIASNAISISVAAPGAGGGIAAAAGSQTGTSGTVLFNNSNGITFGMSGSTQITASHNGLTTARASTDAIGLNTAKTNVTWTVNSSGISLDAGGYAGTGTTFAGANISGSITQNSNGLNLSLSVAAGGAAPNLQYFEAADEVAFGLMTNITAINSRPIFVPLWLPGNLTNNGLMIQMSRSTSASNAFTVQAGLYTYVNSTSIARLASLQNVFSASDTGSVSGVRYFVMSGWENAGTSLTPGAYVLAMNFSAGATASMNYSLFGGLTASQPVGFVRQGTNQNNTNNTTLGIMNMWGRYTANSAALPANVAQADILANFSGASVPLAPWYVMGQVT